MSSDLLDRHVSSSSYSDEQIDSRCIRTLVAIHGGKSLRAELDADHRHDRSRAGSENLQHGEHSLLALSVL